MQNSDTLTKVSAFETRPLYLQVHDRLVSLIAGDTWKAGEMIPNEIDLSRDFGVSVGTMRKALQVLTDQGLLTRRQGRGTFVADQTKSAETPFDNLRNASSAALSWRLTALESSTGLADEVERTALHIPHGPVVRLRRVLLDDATGTVLLEHCTLPADLFPGLASDVEAHVMPIWQLGRRYGHLISSSSEQVKLDTAVTAQEKLLGIPAGTPIVQLSRISISFDGTPIEFRRAFCRLTNGTYYLNSMN